MHDEGSLPFLDAAHQTTLTAMPQADRRNEPPAGSQADGGQTGDVSGGEAYRMIIGGRRDAVDALEVPSMLDDAAQRLRPLIALHDGQDRAAPRRWWALPPGHCGVQLGLLYLASQVAHR